MQKADDGNLLRAVAETGSRAARAPLDANRCRRYGSDVFRTRLMLRPAVCMLGAEAAQVFYEPGRFTRRGAVPLPTMMLLQSRGSVMTLDGEPHRQRKRMFMALLGAEQVGRLGDVFEAEWRASLVSSKSNGRVVLIDRSAEILCRAVCAWAGVPLPENEVSARTTELRAMIEGAGSVGLRSWRGMWLRARSERWVRGLVRAARDGSLRPPAGSALDVIARHRDGNGAPLSERDAAVELINVLRPAVAVHRYITFAAVALHQHPDVRRRATGEPADIEPFVQEVRRYFPFFPAVAGRVMAPFQWREHNFQMGDWVLLDLYGTNHDARTWPEPDRFQPARFRDGDGSGGGGDGVGHPGLMPQGGGGYESGHRCPGEHATIELTKRATRLLLEMDYTVPAQDLSIDLSRLPARPASGLVFELR